MKKLMKAMTLLLAALMLFASCTPDTPEPEPVPPVPEEPKIMEEPAYPEFVELSIPSGFDKGVKQEDVNKDHPYTALHYGLFDNQMYHTDETFRDGKDIKASTTTRYTIYIPENGQPKIQTVVIFTPNDTTAAEFARTETGLAWMKQARDTGAFAVAFVEPFAGGKWNLTLQKPTTEAFYRDERAVGVDIFTSLRTKAITDNAFINVDKNGITLVGYKEGASMAALTAASWPQTFANCICIDAKGFTPDVAKVVNGILDDPTSPHNTDWSDNFGNVRGKQIAMPMYANATKDETMTVPKTDKAPAKEVKYNSAAKILEIWTDVNSTALREDKSAAVEFYKAELITDTDPVSLSKLSLANVRPRGYRGGTIRATSNPYSVTKKGLEIKEDVITVEVPNKKDETKMDKITKHRRWMVYTPETRPEGEKVPMVVVLHGASAAMTDIADESKWMDVADKNGFVVLFIQGHPGGAGWGGKPSTHAPGWQNGDDDYIGIVTKREIEANNIDPSRVYLTGHSAGGFRIMSLIGTENAKLFAGFGPIGGFFPPGDATDYDGWAKYPTTIIPIWMMGGEAEFTSFGGWNAGLEWADNFSKGAKPAATKHVETGYTDGKYLTLDYTSKDGKALPVKATQTIDCPHVYMAEQASLLWDNFFSKLSRDPETLAVTYDGTVFEHRDRPARPPKPADDGDKPKYPNF